MKNTLAEYTSVGRQYCDRKRLSSGLPDPSNTAYAQAKSLCWGNNERKKGRYMDDR
ncbi:hypothetical protein F2P79_014423 [Pimephales promelas]|nr:hypothetical protein F2P79_014423 [Pimephales promelas]